MRRLALLVLALVTLAGCGSGDDPAPAAPAADAGTSTSEEPRRETSADPVAPARGDDDGEAVAGASQGLVRTRGSEPRVEEVASGLEVPWDVAFLPDRSAFVTERAGRIRRITADGRLQRAPVARPDVQALGEGGLMGIDLDPDFNAGQPYAYVMVTRAGQVRVERYRWDERRLRHEETVLDGIVAGRIHDSGRLRFGPDRRLYVVTGDAGRRELAQQRSSLNGKVLTLTPQQYRSRTDRPRIHSIGHRNPQGLDWEPASRRLFVTEHGPSGDGGPSCCDETNLVRAGSNHGWPAFGAGQRGQARPEQLWQDTIAPSGTTFVTLPGSAWTGDHLVAALRGTSLRRLELDGDRFGREEVLLAGRSGRLRSVNEAPDGSIWLTTSNLDTYGTRRSARDDRILRIIPPAG
jgi:glucose/arabinose dehydrogenase